MKSSITSVVAAIWLVVGILTLKADVKDPSEFFQKFDNAAPLVAGPYDREVVNLVGEILQRSHYRGQPLNDDVSSKFLDRYLDALDPQHLYFLQSDVEEFERYRDSLDDLILEEGDSLPARVIFRRFRKRIDQQYDYVKEHLVNESFEFEEEERYLLNRKEEPRPADLEAARKLWHNRLRYEYLQEKLNIGRPEEIARIVREQLDANKPNSITKALQDKISDERAREIEDLVNERLEKKEEAEAIIKAVRDYLDAGNKSEIIKIIARRYNRVLRSINEYENDDVLQIFLTSLANVYDPHSDFMGRPALENFSISMKLSLFGIGALLQSEDGYCKIVSLTPSGPAERSKKLHPNDRIIAVAQGDEEAVDVVDMKLSKVVNLIRGPKGSEVRLTVIPADAPDPSVRKTISIIRDEIKLQDQEAKAKLFEILTDNDKKVRLGVIDLPSFYSTFDISGARQKSKPKSTTTDVAMLLKKLIAEKVDGVILDLRRNGGGSLEEAINLTGLFIKKGPVVQVRDPNGRILVDEDSDPGIYYRGPLVVLTSRFSASASEILAGALQDYGRALVVGDNTTHGKGTVQSLIQLGPILRHRGLPKDTNPGALKITIRKFYRASGASTQLKGIEPDIVLPSVNNHSEVGESSLKNPLEWDTVQAAEFDKLDWIAPHLEELKKRSGQRISESKDYAFIRSEIERYREMIEDKTVSLNESQRRAEKDEADERRKARREEIKSRPKPPGTITEISLKDLGNEAGDAEDTDPDAEPKENGADKEPGADADADADADAEADAEEDEDATPKLDISLEETKRILIDLISLHTKSLAITTASTNKKPEVD